jgi:ABC-type nitrate/sulfonate/bicarbonate transport system substrate-binding protein
MRRHARSTGVPDVLGLILLAQALTLVVAGPATSPEYLSLRVADAEGYFTREGLTVTVRSTRAESGAAEALAQGQADLAATSLEAILRFGQRQPAPPPRLVLGLSAAPPVALLVAARESDTVKRVEDLAGGRVGFATPGGSEQTWVQGVLARAHLTVTQVELVALGSRGVITALDGAEVRAAVVAEPAASALLEDTRAAVLVDLRSPRAVAAALGVTTVNAGVFVRADRRVGDRELTAFARAVLAAEGRIATASPDALAERLPKSVIAPAFDFARRVHAAQALALPDGLVEADGIRATVEMIRAHLPLPQWLRIPRPEELLHLDPLRRAVRSRPPA